MKKNIKRYVAVVMAAVLIILGYNAMISKANTLIFLNVPLDAHVYIKGVEVSDERIVKQDIISGRIHQIANAETGAVYGTKQYLIPNLDDPLTLEVRDVANNVIVPTNIQEGVIDYTGTDPIFAAQINQTVVDSAIAYHNRTGYGSNTGFSKYILQGSDAYNKAVNSDAGRKWGKFVNPAGIANVEVKEIYKYTASAFGAKVTLTTTAVNDYTEIYDLYLLFKNVNGRYYVTNFTYQP